MQKLLVIGDIHMGRLSYSEYIKDSRLPEKQAVLDFIVRQAEDVDKVIILGDCFNSKTPSAETVKDFTNFIERFGDKRVFVIGGNHEISSSGKSALDYLKEITNKNWEIITNEIYEEDGMVFAPFFSTSFLNVSTNQEAIDKILSMLPDGQILFTHQAISGCKTVSGTLTDDFVEPVLPKDIIAKKYKITFAGHIHKSGIYDNIILTGSLFTNEVGEKEKFVWKLDGDKYEKFSLPVRKIIKIEDPVKEDLDKIDDNSVVKMIFTEKTSKVEIIDIKEHAKKRFSDNGAFLIVEKNEQKRERAHYGNGESIVDMPIERLLEIYAEQKKVDLAKLQLAFNLINENIKTNN